MTARVENSQRVDVHPYSALKCREAHTGREVVDLMSSLAHEQGTTIILVTHDNRILDVADRILNMEDGRLI
jgi:ABC-type lipoprotein export system ATPase subunit